MSDTPRELTIPPTTGSLATDLLLLEKYGNVWMRSEGNARLLLVADEEVPTEDGDRLGWVLWWVRPAEPQQAGQFVWDGKPYVRDDTEDYTLDPRGVEHLWESARVR